jgi:hypothetical protein
LEGRLKGGLGDLVDIRNFQSFARLTWVVAAAAFAAPIIMPFLFDALGVPNRGDEGWIFYWAMWHLLPLLWALLFCIGLLKFRWRALWLAPGALLASFWLWYLANCGPGNCL